MKSKLNMDWALGNEGSSREVQMSKSQMIKGYDYKILQLG